MNQQTQTENALAFKVANAKSPVIEGHVTSLKYGGGQSIQRRAMARRLSCCRRPP